jgi:DNA-binding NarL/FixJ family response regulator
MHDTLAQSFAGIGFQLEAIRNGVPEVLSATHQQLDLASDLVHHSHEEARRSIATLRPETLGSGDLITALESCARRMVEGGSVQVVTISSGDPRSMPLRITDTLYRIGQEAIANAVRHAHPATITISLEYERNFVHLLVADDGRGFTEAGDLRGFGLRGMRKRASTISAALQIRSHPSDGTRVAVTASLPPRLTFLSWPRFLWKYFMEHRPNATRQHPIFIVDDHPVVRAGLTSMLGTQAGLEVVGSASSGEEALDILQRSGPDLLLLDLRMPGMNGIDTLHAIKRAGLAARVIVLTSFETDEDIYRAVHAGAEGYLLKNTSQREMVEAIRAVASGKRYIPRHIASRLAERMMRSSLTCRELEILKMLAKGLTNKQIGHALGISDNTVRNHVNSIIEKLEVSDRTEAATTAIQRGLIGVED